MKPISCRKKRYILRHFGGESRHQLAREMKVSKSTVYRVAKNLRGCNLYHLPAPKKCGRKRHETTQDEVKIAVAYRQKYKANCNTLEMLIMAHEKRKMPHNRISDILRKEGLIHVQKKKKKRNAWVRFERKHSLSMWQADWKQLQNGNWIIAFKDDASRLIVASGEFPEATTEHSIEVLVKGIRKLGRPRSMLTGRDAQFYASDKKGKPSGKTDFQRFLEANGIEHILARVKHPQTCGKIERFFGEVEVRLYKWHDFKTLDEVVVWYNNLLPNMSLDYENLETPAKAFIRKMHHKQVIIKKVAQI
jgi:putative transposase